MQTSTAHIKIIKISPGRLAEAEDELAVEEPLSIQLVYQEGSKSIEKNISVTMRTPGHDEELAAGFLFTEGIVQDKPGIQHIQSTDNNALVSLAPGITPALKQAERNFYATAACGVCGKTDIDSIKTASAYNSMPADIRIPAQVFYGLQQALQQQQVLFESTGGLHAAALFDHEGHCQVLREDVGRHNALDKVIGHAFLHGLLPLHESILLLSGRAGFELVQKAYMAGIPVIAAVGAPSSLAVERATECGVTLIGFLRHERFNIYSCSERVVI
jgi:FdhD protein